MNNSNGKTAQSRDQNVPEGAVRVLCAGVPFGANNVGDEAIIAGIVRMIRRGVPRAKITVATGDPETTKRALNVETCPPFGFVGVAASGPEVDQVISEHDVLLWSGATGLSDYPDIPLGLLETAQRLNKRTVVLCVGMNDELNPHLYQVRSRWRPTYDRIQRMTGGVINLAAWIEAYRKGRTYRRMRELLPKSDLVVLRDPDSEANLRRCGVTGNIVVGTDAALGLNPSPLDQAEMPDATRSALATPGIPRLGLCLSAQDPPRNLAVVISVLDRVMADTNASVFGIPINFVTDARLMIEMIPRLKAASRMQVIEGVQDPEEVAGVLGQMDVVVSSRLHGLILASLSDTPLVGIRRGTKIDSFLSPYGLRPAGSFQDLEAGELERQIRDRLAGATAFRQQAAALRLKRKQALDNTGQLLKSVLEKAGAHRKQR